MQHVDAVAGQLNEFGGRKLGAGSEGVDVAANSREGCDGAESSEDCGVSDVSGVEDMFYTMQRGKGFGTEQAVGV